VFSVKFNIHFPAELFISRITYVVERRPKEDVPSSPFYQPAGISKHMKGCKQIEGDYKLGFQMLVSDQYYMSIS
jgi:hypothetical protein